VRETGEGETKWGDELRPTNIKSRGKQTVVRQRRQEFDTTHRDRTYHAIRGGETGAHCQINKPKEIKKETPCDLLEKGIKMKRLGRAQKLTKFDMCWNLPKNAFIV